MKKETAPQISEERIAFETLSVKEAEDALKTDIRQGLSSEEAAKRLEKFGKNKLAEKKKKTPLGIFFEQLNNPMIFVLLAAIAVTVVISVFETVTAARAGWILEGEKITNVFMQVGDWPDVVIILAVILINGIIGTVQEVKAQTSLEALKNLSSPESTVMRDGKKMRVKSTDLVIGDIVFLEEGDTIGADLRLFESYNLKTNESSLTGESLPAEKNHDIVFSEGTPIGDRCNTVYMSTPVSYGRGAGIVTATGMDTEIGKIANALESEEDDTTPLQKVLARLSKSLGLLTAAVVAAVLLVDIIWIFADGSGTHAEAWTEAILSAIALAVAAIPEGLSAVVTIVLSIGMSRMVRVNTVVRKLPSVETLGAVSVVCSDKTGTLTQNKMTVVEAYVGNRFFKSEELNENAPSLLHTLAKGMSLCSNATVDNGVVGDPTEIALVYFANALGHPKAKLEAETPRTAEYPFDSVRKMMSTRHALPDGKSVVYTKGALDSILSRATKICDEKGERSILPEDIDRIYEVNRAFSDKALRVLALAYTEKAEIEESDLVFVGLTAMIDPPRPEAKAAVATFKGAGIATVMITGDHRDTAFAIAKELGIAERIEQCLTGADVDKLGEEELKEACKTVRVFARVSPENKVEIVKAFKANGLICAMTGDGVNDAPSLRAADIGIAMGITGTDVAKGAADMILTDDNFASIEKAVEEGRNIYANIKKTVIFLLSSNIAEVLAMLFIICIGFPAPLLAIHLLWVNLITDSLPAIALGMDPKAGDIMREKPRDPKESIFARGGLFNTVFYGAFITAAVLISYFICASLYGATSFGEMRALLSSNTDVLHHAQTMAFTTLAICELFHMLGMSNTNRSFVQVFKNRNPMMLIAFISGFILQLAVIEIPVVSALFSTYSLSLKDWLIALALALVPLLAHEIAVLIKFIRRKKGD